jgi:hypothetical protein
MEVKPEPPQEHHGIGGMAGFGFATMLMSGQLDETFIARIETVIEHSGQRLNPEMVQQILNSEQFQQRLDEPSKARIRAALARATGQPLPDTTPAPLAPEPAAGQSPITPNAWEPDARTTGDANWQPDGVIQGEDPWHPGGKTDDPWHPDGGAKKNDPWHPGD